ncbi:MAG: hypothetical protein HY912_14400 [Desulfomonile tiedjei]|uniref:Uncharacterized protein n=1 Tax=Desulfomonile tiedjei TaxID=2358 RepID=A0A9D6Z4L8_9BACT|nr:hypothetical protein [Desulfomonile tiedjei]
MMSLTRTEEDYVIRSAYSNLDESQRESARVALHQVMSEVDIPSRHRQIDTMAQGHRVVQLAWLAMEFNAMTNPDTTSRGAEWVCSALIDTFQICLDFGIIGSQFIELWNESGEDVYTFLGHIVARKQAKRALDTAWEQDISGAVS